MKVVINKCYGGFSISEAAVDRLLELECPHDPTWDPRSEYGRHGVYDGGDEIESRACPQLVRVVEELGDEASGSLAELKVVEVPDGVKCHLDEYDGVEHVAEDHETWG